MYLMSAICSTPTGAFIRSLTPIFWFLQVQHLMADLNSELTVPTVISSEIPTALTRQSLPLTTCNLVLDTHSTNKVEHNKKTGLMPVFLYLSFCSIRNFTMIRMPHATKFSYNGYTI